MNSNRYYIKSIYTNSDYSYSDVSSVSTYSCDNDNDNDNDNINRIRDIYDRNSLYTVPRPDTDDYYDSDDLYSIMDLYSQPYAEIDNNVITPVMQLPLSSNQLMLMKMKWDKQLDMDLIRTVPKQTSSWPQFSMSSNESRNSHFSQSSNKSEKSEKSTKSSKSWKSFFSKFTKKSKKNQIKFYENLVKQI